MRERRATSAARVEFGSRSAVSKFFAASTSAASRSMTSVSFTSRTSAKSGATDARAATLIDAAGAVLRAMTLRSNGFGIEFTYEGRGYEQGKKITWAAGFVASCVLLKYRFVE